MRSARLALALAGALAAGGCNWWYNDVPSPDDLMKAVPWFDHMITSPAVHPYETAGVPRATPPGTVPVGRVEPDVGATWATGNFAAAEVYVNPLARGAMLARGDTLYGWFCATCHGQAGAGDGLVGRRMGALPLTSDRAMALSDGYLYAIIRYGRGVMGRYGDKIWEPADRWAVVNYVRELQARSSIAAAGGVQ
ncbi:MAG TPA: cytochrome c [Gemmatimonadales bacterium]|nr:cytochrome c [Gemmatimonadales bacterium]